MDEQTINLGGANKKPITTNNFGNNNPPEIPNEFIDNEFPVPTDEIELPSEGRFYPNGQRTIKFRHLTAQDENILLDSNLIKNGKVIDVLLENSIIDTTLLQEDMISGDRNAVLIALRLSGYGEKYPVKTTCEHCHEEFLSEVNLSLLKNKRLSTEPDNQGEFSVQLPKIKWNMKFRMFTGRDENYLRKAMEYSKKTKKNSKFSNGLTDKFLIQIMEINGNRDKTYIKKAIEAMPIFDSLFLREYIREVEPGVDMNYNFECTKCGEIFESEVPITIQLFWPNAKI